MCPDGIVPCKTFGCTAALGAAWMGTTVESWTSSGCLSAGAETGCICRDTARQKYNVKNNVQALLQDLSTENHDRIHTRDRAARMSEGCICVTQKYMKRWAGESTTKGMGYILENQHSVSPKRKKMMLETVGWGLKLVAGRNRLIGLVQITPSSAIFKIQ